MTPKDREKRWIKQKGCRNAARMWREDLGMWVVVPMNIDKSFTFVTPKWEAKKVSLRRSTNTPKREKK